MLFVLVIDSTTIELTSLFSPKKWVKALQEVRETGVAEGEQPRPVAKEIAPARSSVARLLRYAQ